MQEGQEAVLGCRAFGYPDPHVRWMHNHQVQYEYDNQFEMTLENARVENSGTWTCVVSSQCSEYGPRELRFNIQLVVSSTRLCHTLLAVRLAQAQSQAYSESDSEQHRGKRRDLLLARARIVPIVARRLRPSRFPFHCSQLFVLKLMSRAAGAALLLLELLSFHS